MGKTKRINEETEIQDSGGGLVFKNCLQCARHYVKHFIDTNLLYLYKNLGSECY